MSLCEMCGKSANLVVAVVEGVDLKLCSGCAQFGIVKKQVSEEAGHSFRKKVPREEPQYKVVDNFAVLLRQVREKNGLNQEDFAKLLQEKMSSVMQWEQGHFKPTVEVAQKLGRILKLTVVAIEDNITVALKKRKKGDELTFGDSVKVKKRN